MVVAVVAMTAHAQVIYRWKGADGVEHFTDDPSTIPAGAHRSVTEGEPVSTLKMEAPVLPDAGAPVAVASGEPRPTAEQQWRQEFRLARDRVATLTDLVEVDRVKVEESGGQPLTARLSCSYVTPFVFGQPGGGPGVFPARGPCVAVLDPIWEAVRDRLALNRKALERAQSDLADLERRASMEGIPNEWRR